MRGTHPLATIATQKRTLLCWTMAVIYLLMLWSMGIKSGWAVGKENGKERMRDREEGKVKSFPDCERNNIISLSLPRGQK